MVESGNASWVLPKWERGFSLIWGGILWLIAGRDCLSLVLASYLKNPAFLLKKKGKQATLRVNVIKLAPPVTPKDHVVASAAVQPISWMNHILSGESPPRVTAKVLYDLCRESWWFTAVITTSRSPTCGWPLTPLWHSTLKIPDSGGPDCG